MNDLEFIRLRRVSVLDKSHTRAQMLEKTPGTKRPTSRKIPNFNFHAQPPPVQWLGKLKLPFDAWCLKFSRAWTLGNWIFTGTALRPIPLEKARNPAPFRLIPDYRKNIFRNLHQRVTIEKNENEKTKPNFCKLLEWNGFFQFRSGRHPGSNTENGSGIA